MADKNSKKKKLSAGQIRTIVVASISFFVGLILIITNFFVPVKYLSSYMVSGKRAEQGTMRVRFVDVGYGDAVIIELPDGKNMLIDAGGGANKTTSRVLKYLNSSGIKTIDYLVCSSVNKEHCGGLAEIIRYKKVEQIFMPYCTNMYVNDEYRNFVLAARSSGAQLTVSEYGVNIKNDSFGYSFVFLSPSAHTAEDGEYAELNSNPASDKARNNSSAVIWLEYFETSFLFTSDVNEEVLSGICRAYEVEPDYPADLGGCDIIEVACHGSEDGAYAPFYDLTKPEAAVISVGENGLECPSLDAISDAVNYVGDKLYRTDISGTVTFNVTKEGYSIV